MPPFSREYLEPSFWLELLRKRAAVRRLVLGFLGSFVILASGRNPESTEAVLNAGLGSLPMDTISRILTEDISNGPRLFTQASTGQRLDGAPHLTAYFSRVRQVKSLRDSVLVFAWRQRGVPYVWGGSTPGGFDCSGLLQFSFRRAGLVIPRTAASQATMGKAIPVDEAWLAPGDLLVFQSRKSRYVDHIGMYLGNGQYIHASGGQRRVTVGSLRDPNDISNRILIGARRVFHLPYRQPNS